MNNLNVAKIQLNGDVYELNTGTNLVELLKKLKIQKNKVAIEVNGKIVDGRKKSNPESEERKNKILDLTSQGIGPAKIAEMVGVSRATVQKVKAITK